MSADSAARRLHRRMTEFRVPWEWRTAIALREGPSWATALDSVRSDEARRSDARAARRLFAFSIGVVRRRRATGDLRFRGRKLGIRWPSWATRKTARRSEFRDARLLAHPHRVRVAVGDLERPGHQGRARETAAEVLPDGRSRPSASGAAVTLDGLGVDDQLLDHAPARVVSLV